LQNSSNQIIENVYFLNVNDSEKNYLDFTASLETSFREGATEKQIEIAKNMIKKGFDNDTVAELTGLTPTQIDRLRTEKLKRLLFIAKKCQCSTDISTKENAFLFYLVVNNMIFDNFVGNTLRINKPQAIGTD
jgi:hypothetical protein